MAHSRTTIRHGVAALLTGMPRTADRVFPGRRRPLQDDERPGLCVYTPSETAERSTLKPTLTRSLDLVIAIFDKGPDGAIEDDLDACAAEVEARMGASKTLGIQGVLDCTLVSTAVEVEAGNAAEKLPGMAALVYRVTYRTAPGNAEVMV